MVGCDFVYFRGIWEDLGFRIWDLVEKKRKVNDVEKF